MTQTRTTRPGRRTAVVVLFGVAAAAASAQDRLAGNGPLSSMPGAHETGGDLIWAVPSGAAAGVSGYSAIAYRLAEGFELTSGATIDEVAVYAYQQGAIAGPTIDYLGVELWNGQPGSAGAERVAGDVERNALASAEHTNAFVAMHGVSFTIDRPVYELRAVDLGWTVEAGEYWLVWTLGGSIDGGPYSPYLGDADNPVLGQAMQRVLGAWRPARNRTEGGAQVALPFDVYGSTSCAADLDGDGVLTVFDYLSFLNAYQAGDAQADCNADGEVSIADFTCFETAFVAGCG